MANAIYAAVDLSSPTHKLPESAAKPGVTTTLLIAPDKKGPATHDYGQKQFVGALSQYTVGT